jgi:hypothetical protein
MLHIKLTFKLELRATKKCNLLLLNSEKLLYRNENHNKKKKTKSNKITSRVYDGYCVRNPY